MSVDHSAVLETVRAALLQLDETTLQNIRYENAIDDPPGIDTIYIEEAFNPLWDGPVGSGFDRLLADVRYTVVMARGAGTIEGRALAVRIKELFRAGESLVGKTVVVVESSTILAGRTKDATRYAIPVSVHVRAEAPRNEGV